MAKRNRTKQSAGRGADRSAPADGAVGPRQPCPCGSGRRYKACHGAPGGPPDLFVKRPFEGLPSECDVVALRELVPAATAPLPMAAPDLADRAVTLCTLLPGAAPAMVGDDGSIRLGLQVQHGFGDPSRDLAAVLLAAAATTEPGAVGLTGHPGEGPRLQDLVGDAALEVTVHEGFDFWADGADEETAAALQAALEQGEGAAHPTVRLTSVDAAYWTDVGPKEHLRWVMPEPEDALLDALARVHHAGDDVLVDGARLVGMFRAHGLLAPVWDLPLGTGAEVLEERATAFRASLDDALADTSDLTTDQRGTRSGLANRQVTIR